MGARTGGMGGCGQCRGAMARADPPHPCPQAQPEPPPAPPPASTRRCRWAACSCRGAAPSPRSPQVRPRPPRADMPPDLWPRPCVAWPRPPLQKRRPPLTPPPLRHPQGSPVLGCVPRPLPLSHAPSGDPAHCPLSLAHTAWCLVTPPPALLGHAPSLHSLPPASPAPCPAPPTVTTPWRPRCRCQCWRCPSTGDDAAPVPRCWCQCWRCPGTGGDAAPVPVPRCRCRRRPGGGRALRGAAALLLPHGGTQGGAGGGAPGGLHGHRERRRAGEAREGLGAP